MKNSMKLVMLSLVTLLLGVYAFAQTPSSDSDAARQSERAATVFKEIMQTPDKAVPETILEKAECVAVFPNVIKGGFIFGARGGRGVASCRNGNGWSAPAYFNMAGGSFGLQIGAQATDFVLLFMTKNGIDSLISNKFTIGGDASAAAGPVGRQAGASTDIALRAQILSYSRSRGLFAGLELKGVAVTPDTKNLQKVYGSNVTTKDVLKENKFNAPPVVREFPLTLAQFSSRPAQQ